MKRLLLPTIALLLTSCATMKQEKLNTWIGKPESALIQEWGLPDNHMSNESGQKLYEYLKCRNGGMILPGTNLIASKQICDSYIFFVSAGGVISNTLYKRK